MPNRHRPARDSARPRAGRPLAVGGTGALTLVASLVSGAAAAAAGRPSVTVNSLADPATPTSVVGSHETLADAIEHLGTVTGGGTIRFASSLSGTIELAHALPEVTQPITIDGPGAGRLTVDGGASPGLHYPVLTVTTLSGATTTIEGMTLTDGYAPQYGGAIHAGTPVDIVHCTLRDNRAGDKGGAIFTESSLEIVDSTVSDNRSAHWDGGLAAKHSSGAHVVIDASTFSGNQARSAADGAMYLGSPMLIENSTISGNTVTGKPASAAGLPIYAGGGIAESRSGAAAHTELGIYDSIIAGNHDQAGSGEDLYVANEHQYGAPTTVFSLIGQTTGSGIGQDRGHDDILGSHAHPAAAQLGRLGLHGGSTATLVPTLGSPAFAAGDANLFAPHALPFGTRADQRGIARHAGVAFTGGDGTDIGAVETPKRTRAVLAGDREFAMTTVSPRVAVSRSARLPMLYTVVARPGRHRLRLRFVELELRLSGARHGHVYRHPHGRVQLSLRHLHRGRHRLSAIVTYASGHGRHTRRGDVRLSFTVRLR